MLSNQNHKCKFCEFSIHKKALLTRHIVFEHWNEIAELNERRNYKCKFCEFDAHSKHLMIQHIVSEHWDEIAELVEKKKGE